MKTIFFGSSDYCIPILESLSKNFTLAAVVTKKGQTVANFALSHNVKIFTPKDKTELLQLQDQIRQLSPDLAIVADYGLVIPKEIFSIPRYKTLNIHFSKLPLLRGPSPVQHAILMGEKTAWISIIILAEEIDTGDIIWQSTNYPIIQLSNNPITTEELYKKLFNIASSELPDIINKYVNNELKPQKQNHALATYTKHLTREDGFIPFQLLARALNWKSTISVEKEIKNWPLAAKIPQLLTTNYSLPTIIDRAIRAYTPWPGVWTEVKISQSSNQPINTNNPTKKRLKILQARLEGDKLVLTLVQLEGKKPVSWKQFKEGHPNITLSSASGENKLPK